MAISINNISSSHDPPQLFTVDTGRLPPSRSEDTLVLHTRTAHSRARCSVSATTSPLLPVRPGYVQLIVYQDLKQNHAVVLNYYLT